MASSSKSSVIPEPLSGKFKQSFAYVTIKDRLPVILTKVIDTLYRDRNALSGIDENAEEENKQVISRFAQLRNEMVTNKLILSLKDNLSDVSIWDNYLKKQEQLYGFSPCWFDSPWLYVECYLYRRIRESFVLSSSWQTYDPFRHQKEDSFVSSISSSLSLALILENTLKDIKTKDDAETYCHFEKFVEMSLWGNKCDLSISACKENFQSVSFFTQLENLREKILANDMKILWNLLQSQNHKYPNSVRLDIVLDNAGFELFTDLCLLHFLDALNLVQSVRFYVKTMPWFVSDTLVADIKWLLRSLIDHTQPVLRTFGSCWNENFKSGKWVIEEELFWTTPCDYSEMKEIDEQLYEKLNKSHLILFKGDLNYRKLTSDRQWNFETPFIESLRGFLPAPVCALRTIKADVLTGLKPGVKEELDLKDPEWMFFGEYAVIQCVPLD